MGKKDLSERKLFELNDVFADAINGLLFKGNDIIKEDDLEDIPSKSNLKLDDGTFTHQERDVSKLWKKEGVIISLLGIENQSQIDDNMIFRILGYDSASYKSQLNKKTIYPVVTLVLYYGKKQWDSPISLRQRLSIPDVLKGIIPDYTANVYNLGNMPDEEIMRLKRDFKVVVDFLKNGDTIKSGKITHLPEMLDFFTAFIGDKRFENIEKDVVHLYKKRRGEGMCDIKEVLDRIENRGIAIGEERGIKLGEERGIKLGEERSILSSIKRLMSNLKLSLEEALDALEISEEDRKRYRKMVNSTESCLEAQSAFAGEAERVGLKSDEDVVKIIKDT